MRSSIRRARARRPCASSGSRSRMPAGKGCSSERGGSLGVFTVSSPSGMGQTHGALLTNAARGQSERARHGQHDFRHRVAPPATCRTPVQGADRRAAAKIPRFRAGMGLAKGSRMAFAIDRDVLDRAAHGDNASLNSLVASLSPHIEKQLLRYPVAEEDRRDLLQATMMQVVRRLGSFRGDSSFSTWLFRVTANEALMMMRSQRRHRARLVEGLDFDELGSLPAANDAAAAGDRAD